MAVSPDLDLMQSRAGDASAFLKALSHPARLMLLCRLSEGEMSVGALEAELGLRQAAVSQQLARLREEGLVDFRRDGKAIYYHICDEGARRVLEVVCDIFCADTKDADIGNQAVPR